MAKRIRTLKTRYLKNGRVSLYYRGKCLLKAASFDSAESFKIGWYESQGHLYDPCRPGPQR